MDIFFGWVILSFVVGAIGSSRKIGFFGSLTLSLLLSPLIGLVVTALSKSKDAERREQILLKNTKNQTDSLRKMTKLNYVDELLKLKSLLDAGLITHEEFDNEKTNLERNKQQEDRTFIGVYISPNSKYVDKITFSINGSEFIVPPLTKENAFIIEVFSQETKISIRKTNRKMFRNFSAYAITERYKTSYYDLDHIMKKL